VQSFIVNGPALTECGGGSFFPLAEEAPSHAAQTKMNPLHFFSFQGRMRRKHFALALVIIIALLFGINAAWQVTHIKAIILSRYLVTAALIPACVRRIHDIGLSGWFAIAALLMPLFLIPLLVLPGFPEANKYGGSPKPGLPDDVSDISEGDASAPPIHTEDRA
jgi:uncharacterized membrane protein YhaH (DUF805 family)